MLEPGREAMTAAVAEVDVLVCRSSLDHICFLFLVWVYGD